MTITSEKLGAVVDLLKGYGASRVLLFGSYLANPQLARDLDLAVEGIPLSRLLEADAKAYALLGQPLDLVSKEEDPLFFAHVAQSAKVLHGG